MRYFTKRRQRTLKSCEHRTHKISDNEWHVKNYIVYKSSHKGWICECKHFVYRQTPCSHIVYVLTRMLKPELVSLEVDHMPNRLDKVVFGQTNEMNLIPMISMISMMSASPVVWNSP